MPKSKITCSDHAVLRYMERVLEVDLNDIKQKAASIVIQHENQNPRLKTEYEYVFQKDGNEYRVRNNVLITVVKAKSIPKPSSKKRTRKQNEEFEIDEDYGAN